MKELLETHLDQLNLQLRRRRPRNAVEHPPSWPLSFEGVVVGFPSEAVEWGEAPPAANYGEVCFTLLNTATGRPSRAGTMATLHKAWHTKSVPITHVPEGGRILLLLFMGMWMPALSKRRHQESEYGAWSVFSKEKAGKWQNPKNWHSCLPFKESNTENISNNKRKSGRIVTSDQFAKNF